MDLDGIIRALLAERNRLDQIISALEEPGLKATLAKATQTKKTGERRGRKFMDSAARQEVSERMKRYWAKRRAEAGGGEGGGTPPVSPAASVATARSVSPSGPGCDQIETRGEQLVRRMIA
jgi:hypothetical protein